MVSFLPFWTFFVCVRIGLTVRVSGCPDGCFVFDMAGVPMDHIATCMAVYSGFFVRLRQD